MSKPTDNEDDQRRTTLIVNKSFQWRWILKPVIILLLGLATVCLAVVFAIDYTIGASYRTYIETLESTRQLLWPAALTSSVIVFLVGSALIVWQFTRFTHRVAGPIYRIKESLKELRSGNLSLRITFREGDEFEELSELFNEANQAMDRRVSALRNHVKTLRGQELNEEQQRELQSMGEILEEFKLSK